MKSCCRSSRYGRAPALRPSSDCWSSRNRWSLPSDPGQAARAHRPCCGNCLLFDNPFARFVCWNVSYQHNAQIYHHKRTVKWLLCLTKSMFPYIICRNGICPFFGVYVWFWCDTPTQKCESGFRNLIQIHCIILTIKKGCLNIFQLHIK